MVTATSIYEDEVFKINGFGYRTSESGSYEYWVARQKDFRARDDIFYQSHKTTGQHSSPMLAGTNMQYVVFEL